VRGVNPFTGEPLVVRTRANPNQPEADPGAVQAPELANETLVVSWKWVTEHEGFTRRSLPFGAQAAGRNFDMGALNRR